MGHRGKVVALLVAAGSGTRAGTDIPKQYRKIGGKAVLAHAI
ncbi:MAG TPA: 2-C-methyl-D-erythritol 4-phosphate cytidylyltransferase, partial [Allosphingosinicella sp.]